MPSQYEQDQIRIAQSAASSDQRRSALVKLREMGSEAARPLCLEIIRKERSNQNLRETAIKSLGVVGATEDLELLRQIADGETDEPARFGRGAARKAHAQLAARLNVPSTLVVPSRIRTPISEAVRFQVISRDGHKCLSCGLTQHDGAVLEVDHIIPVSLGGSDALDNLQTLCDRCNRGKSNRDDRDLRKKV